MNFNNDLVFLFLQLLSFSSVQNVFDTKHLGNLRGFKIAIKKQKPTSCPCRICKSYIHGVGFSFITSVLKGVSYTLLFRGRSGKHLSWSTFDKKLRLKFINYLSKRVPQSWMLQMRICCWICGFESVISFI